MAEYVPPEDPGRFETDPGNNGGGDNAPYGGMGGGGCDGKGGVFTELDANGNWVGNTAGTQGECVSADEAARRRAITTSQATGNSDAGPGKPVGPIGSGGGFPKAPNYGPVPVFNAPDFKWGETWQAPTLQDAQNDPGYQFSLNEGLRGLQQSAAAKGHLFTGGTLKDVNKWAGDYANNRYGDVFNRNLMGYQTRFGTAKDTYDREYGKAKDQFAPVWGGWLQNAHGTDLNFSAQLQKWLHDNLSASDIFNAGLA